MMRRLHDLPIRRKLLWISVISSTAALLLAGAILALYEVYSYRAQQLQEANVQADLLAASVTASLEFNEPRAAQDYLNAFKTHPDFLAAAVYAANGSAFASYTRKDATGVAQRELPAQAQELGVRIEDGALTGFWPVRQGRSTVGSVYLRIATEPPGIRLLRYGGVILLVMLGSMLIAMPVTNRMHAVIAAPLRDMAEASRRMAHGEIVEVPGGEGRVDEIGQLQNAFHQMSISLQAKAQVAREIAGGNLDLNVAPQSEQDVLGKAFADMVQNLHDKAETARLIATGDLTVPVRLQSDRDEFGQAFAAMVENLREFNRQVSDSIDVLGSSTTAILSGTTQVAAGASQAAAVISQTSVTLDEVKQTAMVSTQKARYVADAAQRAREVSQAGRQSVEETMAGMQQIREQMEMIADSIVRLSEQTQAIGEIIASVNDLSEQTNLLSVNASIEAAKAGEHGVGFSVVAQEVKSLAVQSRQATAQVRNILGEIQKATTNAVLAAEQGAKVVEAGARQSYSAGEAIQRLADSIAESASAASQIAVSAQQQMVGMDQLAQAMGNIRTATTQNMDSTRQAEIAAHQLHELGVRLKSMAGLFKV